MKTVALPALALASLLASLLAVLAAPSLAQEAPEEAWVFGKMAGGAMGWDTKTHVRNNGTDTASIRRFIVYNTPQTSGDVSFSVMVQEIEFLCAEDRMKVGDGVFYTASLEPNANGHGTDWIDVAERSPDSILKAVACDGVRVSDTQTATSLAAAVAGAQALSKP